MNWSLQHRRRDQALIIRRGQSRRGRSGPRRWIGRNLVGESQSQIITTSTTTSVGFVRIIINREEREGAGGVVDRDPLDGSQTIERSLEDRTVVLVVMMIIMMPW